MHPLRIAAAHVAPVIVRSVQPINAADALSVTLARATSDAVLIGIAGIAAVIWVGSFVFFSLPQMRHRYPVTVIIALHLLQVAYSAPLVALIAPAVVLRALAILMATAYLALLVLQLMILGIWRNVVPHLDWSTAKVILNNDTPRAVELPSHIAKGIITDFNDLMTKGAPYTLCLLIAAALVAIYPTVQMIAGVSVVFVWGGGALSLGSSIRTKPFKFGPDAPLTRMQINTMLRAWWWLRTHRLSARAAQTEEARVVVKDSPKQAE